MADIRVKTRVVVGCRTSKGSDLFGVVVNSTVSQVQDGDHYKAASNYVRDLFDASEPFWCVDHTDPAKILLKLVGWDDMAVIECSKWLTKE